MERRLRLRTRTSTEFLLPELLLLLLAVLMLVGCKADAERASATEAKPVPTPDMLDAKDDAPPPGKVMIEGRHIVTVYQSVGMFTPQDRADRIAERILKIAKSGKVKPEMISVRPTDGWVEIMAGDQIVMLVTNEDAKLANRPRDQLAAEDAGNIRQALLNYRREHGWKSILWAGVYTVLVTLILVPIVWVARRIRMFMGGWLESTVEARTRADEKKTAWHVALTYLLSLMIALGTLVRWALVIVVLQAYLTVVLSFFPTTRSISLAVEGWLFSALASAGSAILEYLPNLFVIVVVAAVASQVIRLVTMVFDEIDRGNLHVPGFYADWAKPTAKLIRTSILVLVLIVVFPYLPGSKSPAFQGVSIFLGVLLSLGSSSAVANGIAGIILTYMRSFLVGDWVRIGETMGEVVEKNILVTRVLTPKHEIITIPNSTVMSGTVMNFTREAKTGGVIFHTTVTIGYDAPWPTVHSLLIEAAKATDHVLSTPEPFVLQTALNDFYVSYELNAYTDTPRKMQFIYSQLHQNIQDRFNEAGVEICSPHFSALRDGNTIAIPQQYISRDYNSPAFRVDGNAKAQAHAHAAGK